MTKTFEPVGWVLPIPGTRTFEKSPFITRSRKIAEEHDALDHALVLESDLKAAYRELESKLAFANESIDCALKKIKELEAENAELRKSREGWVLVPLEPTPAMMEVYRAAFISSERFDGAKVYRAMVDAAMTQEKMG